MHGPGRRVHGAARRPGRAVARQVRVAPAAHAQHALLPADARPRLSHGLYMALRGPPSPAVTFRGPPWLSVAVRGSPVAPCRSKWLSVARSQQPRSPATPLPHPLPNAADRQRIEKFDCHEATRPFFGPQLRRAATFAVLSLYVHRNKPEE